MSIRIDFASDIRWKRSDIERLVKRVKELELEGVEFTVNDLAIVDSDGKRVYSYSSFIAGATIMALVNAGLVEKTGVEVYPVEFEERHWRRGGQSFFDPQGQEVSSHNLQNDVSYIVKTVKSGYLTEKYKTTGRRNKYKLGITDINEYDNIMESFVDNEFAIEKRVAFK